MAIHVIADFPFELTCPLANLNLTDKEDVTDFHLKFSSLSKSLNRFLQLAAKRPQTEPNKLFSCYYVRVVVRPTYAIFSFVQQSRRLTISKTLNYYRGYLVDGLLDTLCFEAWKNQIALDSPSNVLRIRREISENVVTFRYGRVYSKVSRATSIQTQLVILTFLRAVPQHVVALLYSRAQEQRWKNFCPIFTDLLPQFLSHYNTLINKIALYDHQMRTISQLFDTICHLFYTCFDYYFIIFNIHRFYPKEHWYQKIAPSTLNISRGYFFNEFASNLKCNMTIQQGVW